MEVRLAKRVGIAPGEKAPMVVTISTAGGPVLVTEGAGKGKVLWADLAVTASVVSVNKSGVVSLPIDPRVSDGKVGHVTVSVPSQPGVMAELEIPLRYDKQYEVNWYGGRGLDGLSGSAGLDGANGSQGSLDPNHPSAGGNGSNGMNGETGRDGDNGRDGPSVHVWVALRAGTRPLLEVGVSSPGEAERSYMVDPQGGGLTVSSDGGRGGSGGKGGRGGRGGPGGLGTPSGTNGFDGQSGRDGFDGHAGNAGLVTVTYDRAAKPYLSAIQLANGGGTRPVYEEGTVAPLW